LYSPAIFVNKKKAGGYWLWIFKDKMLQRL
jgi:hypothetical protein